MHDLVPNSSVEVTDAVKKMNLSPRAIDDIVFEVNEKPRNGEAEEEKSSLDVQTRDRGGSEEKLIPTELEILTHITIETIPSRSSLEDAKELQTIRTNSDSS